MATTGSLAPISLASTIIGFTSFAFTLATFLRVFWDNLMTIWAAPTEIDDYLSNLKQGLYEERAHLRRTRRRRKSMRRSRSRGRAPDGEKGSRRSSGRGGMKHHVERDLEGWVGGPGPNHQPTGDENDASLRAMRNAIHDMLEKFKSLERPFLKPKSAQNREKPYWEEDEDQWPDYYKTEYRKCGFRERYLWLRRKNAVVDLLEGLSRVETRRIAREVGELTMLVRDVGRDLEQTQDSVYALENRLSRVVGIRRVD